MKTSHPKTYQRWIGMFLILTLSLISTACTPTNMTPPESKDPPPQSAEKIDDWKYDESVQADTEQKAQPPSYSTSSGVFDSAVSGFTGATPNSAPVMKQEGGALGRYGAEMGFAVGGAKDINNFRENIKNGFMPHPDDITYEGLFYNYFFDTGKSNDEVCSKLFCPSYSTAVSKDPLSEKTEYYLSVGLNSGMKEADFKRKKLNLVVVMDISGSMGAEFNQYYYDRFGNRQENDEESSDRTKMEIARDSVAKLLDHLNEDDKFGMVVFDNNAYVAKPLRRVGFTKMDAIREHIAELEPRGGTNMDAGIKAGTKLFDELLEADQSEYENRIIFITDAMPNLGKTNEDSLFNMVKKNAEKKIYTTFIGVGVDFNTELVETMTKVKGANYYSVHSAKEFKKTVDEDFDYMVTPLVFNLALKLDAEGYEIEKVYGSPEAEKATGEIMKINTLFPSKTEGGQTKGGIVLLKLKKTSESGKLKLKVSYEDRNGKNDEDEKEIKFKIATLDLPDYSSLRLESIYDNSGIRKAILLSRYANLLKAWTIDDFREDFRDDNYEPLISHDKGIIIIDPPYRGLPDRNEWERQSSKLLVSRYYEELFEDFSEYFEKEMKVLNDEDLEQELKLLKKLTSNFDEV